MEKYSILGVFCIFELPRLDFLQFQHDFRSFSDKKGHYWGGGGGAKPFGGGGPYRLGGFGSSSIYVKKDSGNTIQEPFSIQSVANMLTAR